MPAPSTSELIELKTESHAVRSSPFRVRRAGLLSAETPAFFWFKGLIRRKIDFLIVSDQLDLNPSTVQKILEGRRVSRGVVKKIEAAFQESWLFNENGDHRARRESHRPNVERLREVYGLYKEEKSLRTVGERLGLSCERVRQLLKKGAQMGLFKYNPSKRRILSREKILESYGQFLALRPVAKANRISMYQLTRSVELHQITRTELFTIRRQEWRRWCLKQYQAVAARLGHHPTTGELLKSKLTRSLVTKIRRLWKSLETFRRESNITPGAPAGEQSAPSSFEVNCIGGPKNEEKNAISYQTTGGISA